MHVHKCYVAISFLYSFALFRGEKSRDLNRFQNCHSVIYSVYPKSFFYTLYVDFQSRLSSSYFIISRIIHGCLHGNMNCISYFRTFMDHSLHHFDSHIRQPNKTVKFVIYSGNSCMHVTFGVLNLKCCLAMFLSDEID